MSKVWFITGCSTGFGKEIAQYALAQGNSVIATARNPDKIELEGDVLKLACDVTDKSSIAQAVTRGNEWKGRIDVVVNNAGFGNLGSIEDTPDDQWKQLYAVNVFGLLDVTKAVLPLLKAQKSGHIINFSSVAGLLSMAGFGPYCSTKFAVEGISEALAQEVGPLGITVSIVEPGAFRTSFVGNVSKATYGQEYKETVGQTEEMMNSLKDTAAGDPAKAAKAVYELTTTKQPPLRLLLGSDAYDWALPKLEGMVQSIKDSEKITKSTNFD